MSYEGLREFEELTTELEMLTSLLGVIFDAVSNVDSEKYSYGSALYGLESTCRRLAESASSLFDKEWDLYIKSKDREANENE